jgi:hypothetical protein
MKGRPPLSGARVNFEPTQQTMEGSLQDIDLELSPLLGNKEDL